MKRIVCLMALVCLCVGRVDAQATAGTYQFDIPASDLMGALEQLGERTGYTVVYDRQLVVDTPTAGVSGRMNIEKALDELLRGSGLTWTYVSTNTIVLQRQNASPTAQLRPVNTGILLAAAAPPKKDADEEDSQRVVVKGKKDALSTPSADIPRTRDDALPFITFDRSEIESSGAVNLEAFFRAKLPANSNSNESSAASYLVNAVASSNINLRGLGASETLILLNGHRMAGHAIGGSEAEQANINTIPLNSVERIEIMPATASAIYGAGATGGVINIITRRDYTGGSAMVEYSNPVRWDAPVLNANFNAGFGFNEGRTHLTLAGSAMHQSVLNESDRGFRRKYLDMRIRNNPVAVFSVASPPVGATPNIRSADGTPLFGAGTSNYTSVPAGYAGGQGLTPFLTRQGVYNLDYQNNNHIYSGLYTPYGNTTYQRSLTAGLSQSLGGEWETYADIGWASAKTIRDYNGYEGLPTTIPASNPNNPFGKAVVVNIPVDQGAYGAQQNAQSQRALIGLTGPISPKWDMRVDLSWDRGKTDMWYTPMDQVTFANLINTSGYNPFRDVIAYGYPSDAVYASLFQLDYNPMDTQVWNGLVRFNGPLYSLPAGDVQLTGGADWRRESLAEGLVANATFVASGAHYTSPFYDRIIPGTSSAVKALYTELQVPLFGERFNRAGVRILDFQMAARMEDYSTFGKSTNPQVAMRYSPVKGVILRGNWGTGFVAPSLTQLVPPTPATAASPVSDPRRGGQQYTLSISQVLSGGNPLLEAEESESKGFGIVLQPSFVEGLRISADFYDIVKSNEIRTLTAQNVLDLESELPGRVTRAAAAPGDPYGVGPATFVDARAANFAKLLTRGWDFSVEQRWSGLLGGNLLANATFTRVLEYKIQTIVTAPMTENLANSIAQNSAPLKYSGNFTLTFDRGPWTFGWFTKYVDTIRLRPTDYANFGGATTIPHVWSHNTYAMRRFSKRQDAGKWGEWLDGTTIMLGLNNVFATDPPMYPSSTRGTSPYSIELMRGRDVLLRLTKDF